MLQICIEMVFFCSHTVFAWGVHVVGRVVDYHICNLTTVENLILACGYDLHLLAIVPFKFSCRAGNSFSREESSTERMTKC